MINNVADLKNRTLVESNILKSFILSQIGGVKSPELDDILIHDYQIANSVTINSILSNYIVNLKYAWALYDGLDDSERESYFTIVQDLDESVIQGLSDSTHLILDVSDGDGTFKTRKLKFAIKPVEITEGTTKFVNLDAVWYGIVAKSDEDGNEWNEIEIVKDMNDFDVNPNPFGHEVNPFSKQYASGEQSHQSFNDWLHNGDGDSDTNKCTTVNCIVENLFRNNQLGEFSAGSQYDKVGWVIPRCQYLVCTTKGLYGLEPVWSGSSHKEFQYFKINNIGRLIKNLSSPEDLNFVFCGFHDVADECNLFIVFSDSTGEYHYMYLNENTYDETYGFPQMKSIVVDQMIVDVDSVFKSVESIKTMDNETIVLTDYGFWDIEPNQTNYTTYSFRGSEKDYGPVNSYDGRADKIVLPTFDGHMRSKHGDSVKYKVIEYDTPWVKDGNNYVCKGGSCNGESWMDQLVGEDGETQHGFVGATSDFAMYNSAAGEPAYILTKIDKDTFNQMLFTSPGLVSYLIRWLYEQVVQPASDTDKHAGEGEYYLYHENTNIVDKLYSVQNNSGRPPDEYRLFANHSFQIPNDEQTSPLIGGKFESVYKIAGSPSGLVNYCNALYTLENKDIAWLFDKSTVADAKGLLRNHMRVSFRSDYKPMVNQLVETVLDDLTQKNGVYPLLSYFRRYLKDKLVAGMGSPSDANITIEDHQSDQETVVNNVVDYIKNNTVAARILGDRNHDGIQNYLHHNRIQLNRSDVLAIMSPGNTVAEIALAVQSMPFFKDYLDYASLNANKNDGDLFKISQNRDFAYRAKTCGSDGKVTVHWEDTVQNWIFDSSKITEESVLKAFVRTQFYRPLFFKADNYDKFSEQDYTYWCKTDKYYVNHNGYTRNLVLTDAGGETVVNLSESHLTTSEFPGTSSVSAEYLNTNVLNYHVRYNPIAINDDMFVVDDIEFFAVKIDGKIHHLCFNQFQNEVQPSNYTSAISGNRFKLNGIEYEIEGGKVVSVDNATQVFDENATDSGYAPYKEFKGEIVKDEMGDRIRIDGVWYVLEKESGAYASLKYAGTLDSKMVEVPITEGKGYFAPLDMHFEFNSEWNSVTVVKDYRVYVMDRLKEEGCQFDSYSMDFIGEKTYEWHLANKIQSMIDDFPMKRANIEGLGHGVLYSGFLKNGKYDLEVEHEMQSGHAITKGVLVKTSMDTGEVVREDVGILFDGDLSIPSGKMFNGNMVDNLCETNPSGPYTIILKDPKGKKNNCNAIWISRTPDDRWMNSYKTDEKVGVVVPVVKQGSGSLEHDSLSSSYEVQFNLGESSRPEVLVLDPVVEVDEDFRNVVNRYRVRTREDGIGTFDAYKVGDKVHVVANGQRYLIDLQEMDVYRFVFTKIEGVYTMDFSTQYSFGQLRENLLSNLKQYMMNQIVEKMVSHSTNTRLSVSMEPVNLNWFVDLFPIQTELENFTSSMGVNPNSTSALKFEEIYQGNLRDVDESGASSGNAYKFIEGKVRTAFTESEQYQSMLLLVDESSISVPDRPIGGSEDTFTYKAYFDLYLRASKEIVEGMGDSARDKCMIGNAVIKEVECDVTFIPTYVHPERLVKYKVQYTIKGGTYSGYFDQVIYNSDGKVRVKAINKTDISVSIPDWTSSDSNEHELLCMKDELAENHIEELITGDRVKQLIIDINRKLSSAITIGYNIIQNPDSSQLTGSPVQDGVWSLFTHPPVSSKVIYRNEGSTVIDGSIYNVVYNDGSYTLNENKGTSQLQIVKDVKVHDSSSISTGNPEGVVEVAIAKGEKIVDSTDISTYFDLASVEHDTWNVTTNAEGTGWDKENSKTTVEFLKFKNSKLQGSTTPTIAYNEDEGQFEYGKLKNLSKTLGEKPPGGKEPPEGEEPPENPEYGYVDGKWFSINGWQLSYTLDEETEMEINPPDPSGSSSEDSPQFYNQESFSIWKLVNDSSEDNPLYSILANMGQDLSQGGVFEWPEEDDEYEDGEGTIHYHHQHGRHAPGEILPLQMDPGEITFEQQSEPPPEPPEDWHPYWTVTYPDVPAGNFSKTIEFSLDGGEDWFGKPGKFSITVEIDRATLQNLWERGRNGIEIDANAGKLTGEAGSIEETLLSDECSVKISGVEPAYEFASPLVKETGKFGTTMVKYELSGNTASGKNQLIPKTGDEVEEPVLRNIRCALRYVQQIGVVSNDGVLSQGFQAAKMELDLSFQVKVKKTKYDVFLHNVGSTEDDLETTPGEQYVFNRLYYGGAGKIMNVIPITDLNGGLTYDDDGTFGYGYMDYPTNIGSVIADNRSFSDLQFRKIFSEITGGTVGDGYYCPCTVQAIPPDDEPQKQGDIYNRHFDIKEDITVQSMTLNPGDIPSGQAWMEKSSTLKSIRSKETSSKWKNLINTSIGGVPTNTADAVPESMRQKVTDLVLETLKMDSSHFRNVLEQLRTFLSNVNSELNQDEGFSTWNRNEIRAMCRFGYDAHVKYEKYGGWGTGTSLFDISNETYAECLKNFNTHLYNEFYSDFQTLLKRSDITLESRDYNHILSDSKSYGESTYPIKGSYDGIYNFRQNVLEDVYDLRNHAPSNPPDLISTIFGDRHNDVRYMNRIRTSITGDIDGNMYLADGVCHVLSVSTSPGSVTWYTFDPSDSYMNQLLENKKLSIGTYQFSPEIRHTDYSVDSSASWKFRFANRDLPDGRNTSISDAFVVRCKSDGTELWYLSELDAYLYAPSGTSIVDIAYEQYGDSVYAIFSGDPYLYRFDHLLDRKDSHGKILLQGETADMKIETFHSVNLGSSSMQHEYIYLDYTTNDRNETTWEINLYGTVTEDGATHHDVETWSGNPGRNSNDFRNYNVLMFGDTLFNSEQLKFQNISKNKEMFDILDIDEVDGCYYGLFKDEKNSTDDETLYTVFKTAPSYKDARGIDRTGVVQRLPYKVVDPSLYRTNDDLYSLYVVEKTSGGTRQLREISVPDSDIYTSRTIPLQEVMEPVKKDSDGDLSVHQMIMTRFRPGSSNAEFFVLSNWGEGFHRIYYVSDFSQLSIDSMNGNDVDGNPLGLNDRLVATFREKIIGKHMEEKHNQVDYFKVVSSKVNQFSDGFTTFSLIPTEFYETQDIGVIPDKKVDDTDEAIDHRGDSLQVSTDILWTDGMVAGSDANPGLVTAAVSNPSTTYDSDYVFLKSQRNPSIVGTEFYDYITDVDGNPLMDLYSIPFIYRVNTNNTYDLYINVPTTRTKYLNRIAGTLKDDGTTQVLKDDYRTRRNFLDEAMPNNLDESTTKLRVYIDRKYVSIGNVELVEISGNSIPLQIYRDTVNHGLYDSIALEGRWNGEVVELNDPAKDVNKVMLEFECYGTDSQSIHIQGKTLINHALDDKKYKFGQ